MAAFVIGFCVEGQGYLPLFARAGCVGAETLKSEIMLSSVKFWVGIGLSVALLALFLLTTDVGHMLEALAQANYVYVIPATGLYMVGAAFRTMRWRLMLRHMKVISVGRLFPVVIVGYMANNILPMRLGEFVRSYYLGEREGVSKTAALTTVLIERILDALTLLFFIAAIALFVPLYGVAEGFGELAGVAWPLLAAALSLPFVCVFGALLLFAAFPDRARAMGLAAARPLPDRFEGFVQRILDMFLHGLYSLRSPRALAALFALSLPVWLFEAGVFFLVGMSFDLHNVYPGVMEMAIAMMLVSAVSNIGASVPAAPGGLGLFEIIAREALVLLPLAVVDRAVAGGFAAAVHAVLLLVVIVPGLGFLWADNMSLRRLTAGGRPQDAAKL